MGGAQLLSVLIALQALRQLAAALHFLSFYKWQAVSVTEQSSFITLPPCVAHHRGAICRQLPQLTVEHARTHAHTSTFVWNSRVVRCVT